MSDTRGPEFGTPEEAAMARDKARDSAPEAADDIVIEAEAEDVTVEDARPRARLLPMWILLAAVILVGIAWAVSERYFSTGESGGEVPLLTAEETPVKVRPEEPGGVDVPDRDKYIYKSLTDAEPDAEQLLPPPEEPMERPPVAVAELAAPPGVSVASEETDDMAEAMEAAPEPDRQDRVAEAAAGDEAAAERAPAAIADSTASPAAQPEQLLDAVAPESDMTETVTEAAQIDNVAQADPEPAPEPEPEPEAEPEPPAAPPRSAPTGADGPGFMVQVGASRIEAAATAGLTRLAEKHPRILGRLDAVVVRADLGAKGVWYRMRVGPFAARGDADGVCRQLKAVDVGCFIVAN
jgi:cell division protein FtsN